MIRSARFVGGVALLSILPAIAAVGQTLAQSKPATVTATIESIDKATRTVTLKRANGTSMEIKTPPEMQGFDKLKVGDQVTATYYEATAVSVRKPGDPAPPAGPTTVIERKERAPGLFRLLLRDPEGRKHPLLGLAAHLAANQRADKAAQAI